jgi:hypothetical protein
VVEAEVTECDRIEIEVQRKFFGIVGQDAKQSARRFDFVNLEVMRFTQAGTLWLAAARDVDLEPLDLHERNRPSEHAKQRSRRVEPVDANEREAFIGPMSYERQAAPPD